MAAHGQRTRQLKRPGTWREPISVTLVAGTVPCLSDGRLGWKYANRLDKYTMDMIETTDNPPLSVEFEFAGVPNSHDLKVFLRGWYTGNHATPHAPRIEIYDWVGTGWDDAGAVFSIGQSAEELAWGTVLKTDAKYWSGGKVKLRVQHPPIAGNVSHQLHLRQIGLDQHHFTTTTTSTTTTTTTT